MEEKLHLVLVDILRREEDSAWDLEEDEISENLSTFLPVRRTISLVCLFAELSEVATTIVYTLCCERNYCNQLLVAMVKDKLLEGVQMLVDLGADVNYGEEPDTPICLAVEVMDREIVEYLLSKVSVARLHSLSTVKWITCVYVGLPWVAGSACYNDIHCLFVVGCF